jgi:transketolase
MTTTELDQLCINTIRTLSMDAVQQAKSGHPGTPMALAPLVYTIWNRVMRFDPQDPIWPNRDRFVLSNGHASMLLWSALHLTKTQAVNAEYERLGQPSVTLDDIRRFRQLDSHAPGHPEYHWVSGVETTTGPLGQGVATSVGMAMAQKWLAARYNRPGFDVFDYNIYSVCGDGCMMEGIASEAASLAAHLGLDNLCWSSTTTTSPLKATRGSHLRRTLQPGFWVTAGTFCGLATPMIPITSNTPWRSSARRKAVPLSSFSTAISATVRLTNRTPLRPMGSR